MLEPKYIVVDYFITVKGSEYEHASIGFAFDPRHSLVHNIETVIDFVRTIHNVRAVLSLNLEF